MALLAGASFDTQYMYDNISVEQSGKGPGRILKTSPDLSTVAVIANARQGENVSLLWVTALRMDPVTSVMGEGLGEGNRHQSHNFKEKETTGRL